MGDLSWIIYLVLGGGVLAAVVLMVVDWRRDTIKCDLRNAAIALVACTIVFLALNALHVRHGVLIFAPLASALTALFTEGPDVRKMAVHLFVLGTSIAMIAGQYAIDALHLTQYTWQIGAGACLAVFALAWGMRKAQQGITPFGPRAIVQDVNQPGT